MPIRKSNQRQKAKTNECIVVAGINTINQISTKSNNINHYDAGIVSPPIFTSFKKDDHLSYSVYFSHSVVVKKDSAYSIGVNTGNKKTQEKPKLLSTLSEIELEFEEKNNYSIASAVCGSCYTLYLLNPLDSEENPLLACYWESQKEPSPVFIYLNDLIPIALFGGRKMAAAIDDKGDIIAITETTILSEDHKGEIISLPNNEKATFVSCLEKTLIILSNEGKVYEYNIGNSGEKEIEEIEELKEIRIKTLSGTWRHCLAVTEDGEVYGRGFNEYGQLCQSEEKKRIDQFEKIKELEQEHIESAYAGSYHSLFINTKGEVISSGRNENGELLLSEGSSEEIKNTPCSTSIKEGARYCIAGCQLSCVFINCDPPDNQPNQIVSKFISKANKKNTQKVNTQPEDFDQDNNEDLDKLQSKLSKMKEQIEANNKFFGQILNGNKMMLSKLQIIEQAIDKSIEAVRSNILNFEKQKNSSSKKKSTNLDNDEDIEVDNTNKKNKTTKTSRKLNNSINQEDIDEDNEDIPYKRLPSNKISSGKISKNKQKKVATKRVQEEIEEDDNEEEDAFLPPKSKTKNRTKNIIKNTQNTNNKKYSISSSQHEFEYDDEDEDEDFIRPSPNKMKKTNQKKANAINIQEEDNENSEEEMFSFEPAVKNKIKKSINNQKSNTKNSGSMMRSKQEEEENEEEEINFVSPRLTSSSKKNTAKNNSRSMRKKELINTFQNNIEIEDEDEDEQIVFQPIKQNKSSIRKTNTKPRKTQTYVKNINSGEEEEEENQYQNSSKGTKKGQMKNKKSINNNIINSNNNSDDDFNNEEDDFDAGTARTKILNKKTKRSTNKKASAKKSGKSINDDDDNFNIANETRNSKNGRISNNTKPKTKKNNFYADDQDNDDDFEQSNSMKKRKIKKDLVKPKDRNSDDFEYNNNFSSDDNE